MRCLQKVLDEPQKQSNRTFVNAYLPRQDLEGCNHLKPLLTKLTHKIRPQAKANLGKQDLVCHTESEIGMPNGMPHVSTSQSNFACNAVHTVESCREATHEKNMGS